jgi:hypothetical protein
MSRFVPNVRKEEVLLEEMFEQLVQKASELLPGFVSQLSFDGKAPPRHSTGRRSREKGGTSDPDRVYHDVFDPDLDMRRMRA